MTSSAKLDPDLSLIVCDANGFGRLLGRREDMRTLLVWPHASMFVIESLDRLRERGLASGSLAEHEDFFRRCRQSLKLLDDRRSASVVLNYYARVVSANHRAFVERHLGPLASLKRFLQTDLGLFMEDSHLVGTTHLTTTYLGMTDEELALLSLESLATGQQGRFESARVLGQYLSKLRTAFALGELSTRQPLPPLGRVDVKTRAFYAPLLRRTDEASLALAMLLTSVLASANSAIYTFSKLDGPARGPSSFLLKWRLVTLFHCTASLKKALSSDHRDPALRSRVVTKGTELRRRLRFVERCKTLRDALVHYDLGGRFPGVPTPSAISEAPLERAHEKVLRGLTDISVTLSDLLGCQPETR